MAKAQKTTTISAVYKLDDIKDLIIADMATQGHTIERRDIELRVDGGYLDDGDNYWGGPSVSKPKCVPVEFYGFIIHKKVEDAQS